MSRRTIKDPNRKRTKRPHGEDARRAEMAKKSQTQNAYQRAAKTLSAKPAHEQKSRLSDDAMRSVRISEDDDGKVCLDIETNLTDEN